MVVTTMVAVLELDEAIQIVATLTNVQEKENWSRSKKNLYIYLSGDSRVWVKANVSACTIS